MWCIFFFLNEWIKKKKNCAKNKIKKKYSRAHGEIFFDYRTVFISYLCCAKFKKEKFDFNHIYVVPSLKKGKI